MGELLLISAVSMFGAAETPEGKALTYLSREVPAWSADNKCYSCHNNGDAARALFAAVRLGRPVPAASLDSSLDWLKRPKDWDSTGGDTPAKDTNLGRVQFSAALLEAVDAGLVRDRGPLTQAAELLAAVQKKDGSWRPEGDEVGSPATYGAALATHSARRVLLRADAEKYGDAVRRAQQWLTTTPVETVIDAAAVLWALEGVEGESAGRQRSVCLDIIRKGRGKDGGWGAYLTSASEPFDTAVVLLALRQFADRDEMREMIRDGRRYLLRLQTDEGHWPETTRPAGGTSYAQRLSTTGWVTYALLTAAPPE